MCCQLDADVVGCNVVGDNTMVVATDTTNPRSRINVGDPFQVWRLVSMVSKAHLPFSALTTRMASHGTLAPL